MRHWLKDIREKSGYSQYAISRLTGLSQSYYASVESGTRGEKLPVPTAKKIAKALNFDWTKFYEESERNPKPDKAS